MWGEEDIEGLCFVLPICIKSYQIVLHLPLHLIPTNILIFLKVNGRKDYLYNYLRHISVWNDPQFWVRIARYLLEKENAEKKSGSTASDGSKKVVRCIYLSLLITILTGREKVWF